MKKTLQALIISCSLLSMVGCNKNEFIEYPHEYTGIIETRVKTSGVVIASRYVTGNGKVIYQVDCSKDNSAFNKIIFNQNDGDEEFKIFLMQNVGKRVKVKVNVIAKKGCDHEASYGTFEITEYEVINN